MGRKTFKKKITTPDLLDRVNPLNKRLSALFMKHFSSKSSKQSAELYQSCLNIFFVWNLINNNNKFFVKIKRAEFLRFFDYCTDELQWGYHRFYTENAVLSSLSSFIETYLYEEFPAFRNQVKNIEKPEHKPSREKTVLTEAQINSLLNHLVREEKYNQACFIALAISCGARISELLRFGINSIDLNRIAFKGLFLETTNKIKTKGPGRGGKMLHKYILRHIFEPYYKAYLKQREHYMLVNELREHGKLFVNSKGAPITKNMVSIWNRQWSEFLTNDKATNPDGKEVYIYAHCFRHYFVTYLSRIGVEKEFIVDIMGWDSDEMYEIYNDLTIKDKDYKSLSKLKMALIKPKVKEYDNTPKSQRDKYVFGELNDEGE